MKLTRWARWTTLDKRHIRVKDMDSSHVLNTHRMLVEVSLPAIELAILRESWRQDSITGIWPFGLYEREGKIRDWIALFRREIQRRKLHPLVLEQAAGRN